MYSKSSSSTGAPGVGAPPDRHVAFSTPVGAANFAPSRPRKMTARKSSKKDYKDLIDRTCQLHGTTAEQGKMPLKGSRKVTYLLDWGKIDSPNCFQNERGEIKVITNGFKVVFEASSYVWIAEISYNVPEHEQSHVPMYQVYPVLSDGKEGTGSGWHVNISAAFRKALSMMNDSDIKDGYRPNGRLYLGIFYESVQNALKEVLRRDGFRVLPQLREDVERWATGLPIKKGDKGRSLPDIGLSLFQQGTTTFPDLVPPHSGMNGTDMPPTIPTHQPQLFPDPQIYNPLQQPFGGMIDQTSMDFPENMFMKPEPFVKQEQYAYPAQGLPSQTYRKLHQTGAPPPPAATQPGAHPAHRGPGLNIPGLPAQRQEAPSLQFNNMAWGEPQAQQISSTVAQMPANKKRTLAENGLAVLKIATMSSAKKDGNTGGEGDGSGIEHLLGDLLRKIKDTTMDDETIVSSFPTADEESSTRMLAMLKEIRKELVNRGDMKRRKTVIPEDVPAQSAPQPVPAPDDAALSSGKLLRGLSGFNLLDDDLESTGSIVDIASAGNIFMDMDATFGADAAQQQSIVGCHLSHKGLFFTLCPKNRGELSEEELGKAMTSLRIPAASSIVRATLRAADVDQNGRVSLEEFLAFLRKREDELKEMFDQIDTNKDGYITLADLRMARDGGILEQATDDELSALVEWMDTLENGCYDGRIQFEEFRTGMILMPPATTISDVIKHFREKGSPRLADRFFFK